LLYGVAVGTTWLRPEADIAVKPKTALAAFPTLAPRPFATSVLE
jgi:hypothetical protein